MVIMSCLGDVALHDRLPVLWQQIEDAHYSYLEMDDSPEKLKQKKILQGFIVEYLSLVPNECKFGLPETGKVFQRTVNELPEYSAYRAGIGWAALARYAANLLAQPWRKEYKVIRLYCGFYKHDVEANLVGAEALLTAMGYRALGGGRMVLEGPVCPDMAAAVSRDALIAQCECQIMASIWEGVWSSGGRVSWAAVAADRLRPSALFVDHAVYSNMPAPCRCADALPPCELPYGGAYAGPQCYPLPPVPAHVGGPTARSRVPVVPTARLIEYDSERDDRRPRRPGGSEPRPAPEAREDGTGTYESWDYVFRNLSSKNRDGHGSGFSQSSDRLDRDEPRKYRPTTVDLEDGLRALHLDRSQDEEAYRTAKVNESLMRLKRDQESKKARRRPKKTEAIGNPNADGLVASKVASDKVKLLTKKEIKDRKEVLKLSVNGLATGAELKKLKKPAKWPSAEVEEADGLAQNGGRPSLSSSSPRPAEAERWQCATCTFLNARGLPACDMCGKSRKGPRLEPLTSGGRECPACTLVNGRHADLCDACGTALAHCPTYI